MDPLNNDWSTYQARELSYFFDYLDAHFIRMWINWKIPHFFSLFTIIFYSAMAVIFLVGGNKIFNNLSKGSILAVSSLILVMPGTFWGLGYFRSSKPACALSLALISFCLYYFFHNFRDESKRPSLRKASVMIIIMEFFMMMMDRQGMFFALVITGGMCLALSILAWRKRDEGSKRLIKLTLYSFGVIAAGAYYNWYLGPQLIFSLNEVFPGAEFQKMGITSLFNFQGGLTFFMWNMGGMLGGLGSEAGYIFTVLIGLGILLPWFDRKSSPEAAGKAVYLFIAYGYLVAAMIGAANIMTTRHPAMLQPDVIRGNYFVPNMVIMIFFLLVALNSVSMVWRYRYKKSLCFTVLALLLLMNISYLPAAKSEIESGHLSGQCQNSQALLQVLRHHEIDYQTMDFPIREFNFIATARREVKLQYIREFHQKGISNLF